MSLKNIREALSWLKLLQVTEVIVESDSLSVINSLYSNERVNLSIGVILDDRKSLQQDFNKCVFSYMRRSTNFVAYCLLRITRSLSGRVKLIHNLPLFISDVLAANLI